MKKQLLSIALLVSGFSVKADHPVKTVAESMSAPLIAFFENCAGNKTQALTALNTDYQVQLKNAQELLPKIAQAQADWAAKKDAAAAAAKATWSATAANAWTSTKSSATAVAGKVTGAGSYVWGATKGAAVNVTGKVKTAGVAVKSATVNGFNTSVAQVQAHPYIAGGVAAAVIAGGLAYVYWKNAYADELEDDLLV